MRCCVKCQKTEEDERVKKAFLDWFDPIVNDMPDTEASRELGLMCFQEGVQWSTRNGPMLDLVRGAIKTIVRLRSCQACRARMLGTKV